MVVTVSKGGGGDPTRGNDSSAVTTGRELGWRQEADGRGRGRNGGGNAGT